MIKFFDIGRQYQRDKEAYLDLADQVFSSGQMVNGPRCRELESRLTKFSDRRYAITLGSCTDALGFLGRHLVVEDTTVFFPLISFPATNRAFLRHVEHRHYSAEYVDVDMLRLIDLTKLERALESCNSQHKIIVWVNIFGNTIDYSALVALAARYSAVLVEDAAQSWGARDHVVWSGQMGHASTLSFDPTKNLNAFGMGGALLTDDAGLASAVDTWRRPHTPQWINHGYNSQMNEIDAAVVTWKMDNIFYNDQKRRADIAGYYSAEIAEWAGDTHEWKGSRISANHKYVLNTDVRDGVRAELAEAGVETKIHYEHTLIPAPGSVADSFTGTSLSLPLYPELSDAEVEFIASATFAALKKLKQPRPIVNLI